MLAKLFYQFQPRLIKKHSKHLSRSLIQQNMKALLYLKRRQFSVHGNGQNIKNPTKWVLNGGKKHRKYSLIAGTTACAAVMSTYVVSVRHVGSNTVGMGGVGGNGNGNINSNSSNKSSVMNDKDTFESIKINVPLFMPHSLNLNILDDDCFDNNIDSNNDINNNKELKLQLVYNYARQCRILGKSDKLSMINWLEYEINKHNNYSCNYSNSNNFIRFALDKNSVHLGNISKTGQRYLLYTIIDLNTHKKYQYIIIRGTKNWKNIQSQLASDLIFDDKFGMYLHDGYRNATHIILNDIINHIDPTCKLRLIGHSYGGVLCTLLGYYLTCANDEICKYDLKNSKYVDIIDNIISTNNSSNNNNNNNNNDNDKITFNIDLIVTFGMPEFTDKDSSLNLVDNNRNLPLLRVEHINDYIARFDWNRFNKLVKMASIQNKLSQKETNNNSNNTNKSNNNKNKTSSNLIYRDSHTRKDLKNNEIFYIGDIDIDETQNKNNNNENSNIDDSGKSSLNRIFSSLMVSSNILKKDFDLQKFLIGYPRCIHRMRDYQKAIESQLISKSNNDK